MCLVVPPRAPIEGPAPVLLFLTGQASKSKPTYRALLRLTLSKHFH